MAVSENTQKVLEYIKENSDKMLTKEMIAEALGLNVKSVTPMVNYWVSERGGAIVARTEPQEIVDAEGNKTNVKYIFYKGA